MTSRYERLTERGATGAGSAASFATANGGFVTPVNPSPVMDGLEKRSDLPAALEEERGVDGQALSGETSSS
ncbi:hypothetical protein ACVWYH_006205 [Bradyrhizobium sp. GM24.11]